MTKKDSCLVTGAAGFVGSHVVRTLLKETSLDVVAMDDLSGGFKDNLPDSPRLSFVEGSVTNHQLVDEIFKQHEFRYVYHLAAYAAEGLSHFIRRFNYENNVIGSINVINASVNHGVESFVFTSSIAVYGVGQVPMREDMVPVPEDPYGIAKLAVELDLKAAHEMHGLNYVVFRPHNVYGEYQNIGDKYRNVVGIFMNQIMRGEPMTIFGDGTQQRAFSYVGDISGPIVQSAWTKTCQQEVFNIGADTPYTVQQLASVVATAMGKSNHPIQHLEPRNEVHTAYSDHSKAHTTFTGGPNTSLEAGIQKMADWVQEHGARSSSEFSNIEILQNLPDSWLPKE